jgi:polyisoprenoid-binding protein YceI
MRKLLHRITLTGLLLFGAGPGFADEPELCQPFMTGNVDASLLEIMLSAAENGQLYRIQQDTSRMGFCVQSQLSLIKGEFKDFQGGLVLHPMDDEDGQTMVVIKTDSVDTRGILVRNMFKGKDFFDVERNPEILFVSKGFEWTGRDTAVLKGDLTLRGITRPVTFAVTLTRLENTPDSAAEKVLVKASTIIDRTEFGMKSLTNIVDETVKLCMTVEALKYRPGSV